MMGIVELYFVLAITSTLCTAGVMGYLDNRRERKLKAAREEIEAIKAQTLTMTVQGLKINTQMLNPLSCAHIRHPTVDIKYIATAMGVSVEVLRHFGVIGEGNTVTQMFGINVMKLAECATEIDAIRNDPTGLTAAMYGINLDKEQQ